MQYTDEIDCSLIPGAEACGICGRAPWNGMDLDHNHETGEVRGWLCHGCNVSLGRYEGEFHAASRPAFDAYLARGA